MLRYPLLQQQHFLLQLNILDAIQVPAMIQPTDPDML